MVPRRYQERRIKAVVVVRQVDRGNNPIVHDGCELLGPVRGAHWITLQGVQLAVGSDVASIATAANGQRNVGWEVQIRSEGPMGFYSQTGLESGAHLEFRDVRSMAAILL